MRVLADPETGELVEVLEENTVAHGPYEYAEFRRAAMTISIEHRKAINDAEATGVALAKATAEYRKALATEVIRMKAQHGATNAEAIAKGSERVAKAHEELLAAQAREKAAVARVFLTKDDRGSLATMGSWSKAAEAEGWRG